MGKRTAQKDTIIDTTSDSQVNSNLPYRWSPPSLTFKNCFYLFLCLYITRITINNNAPHLNSPKNQNRRAAFGRPAMKLLGGLNQFSVDQPSPFILFWPTRQNNYKKKQKKKKKKKRITKKKKSKAGTWN